MNKKIIIWVVVAVVVVGGLAWWLVGRSSSPNTVDNTNQVAGSATQAPAGSPMSLKALFALGTSQKCTFSNPNPDGSNTSGVIYIAAGHMRGDFTSQSAAGQTTTSHMITDGTTSYLWTDQMAQGMKMSFNATGTMAGGTAQGGAQSNAVDPNQPMNYSCSGWSPDQSEFALPANVTFMDMATMMQNMGAGAGAGASAGAGAAAGAGGGNSAMCAQCNAITNASGKASCLAALGCK